MLSCPHKCSQHLGVIISRSQCFRSVCELFQTGAVLYWVESGSWVTPQKLKLCYPLSTSRNQVLVQSQCYCQFLVGSTGEPFKNRLLFHRLESQYRARSYVTEYVSCFVSLARQRQTQQTCSRCIAPLRSIGTQHTKATARAIQKHKEPSAFQSLPQHPDASHRTVRVAPIHPEQA